MADLFNILKITVGDKKLTARVLVNPGMPLMTSENVEATARVYYLAPAIADHLCLGDAGSKFQDCMGHTEMAHLLEHLSVEIMNETGLAGDVSTGRTRSVDVDPRLFDVELSCPDDALAIGALSSATFMMNWAFLAPEQTPPDFSGTCAALRHLVLSLRGEQGDAVEPDASEQDDARQVIDVEGAAPAPVQDGASAVYGGAAADPSSFVADEGDYACDPGATAPMRPL